MIILDFSKEFALVTHQHLLMIRSSFTIMESKALLPVHTVISDSKKPASGSRWSDKVPGISGVSQGSVTGRSIHHCSSFYLLMTYHPVRLFGRQLYSLHKCEDPLRLPRTPELPSQAYRLGTKVEYVILPCKGKSQGQEIC